MSILNDLYIFNFNNKSFEKAKINTIIKSISEHYCFLNNQNIQNRAGSNSEIITSLLIQILYNSQNTHKKINKLDQRFRQVHKLLSNEQIECKEIDKNAPTNEIEIKSNNT